MKKEVSDKFKKSKILKADLPTITGGRGGVETDTCQGTTKDSGWFNYDADSSSDGDWYPDC